MKKIFFTGVLFTCISLSLFVNSSNNKQKSINFNNELSNEELASITGTGCGFKVMTLITINDLACLAGSLPNCIMSAYLHGVCALVSDHSGGTNCPQPNSCPNGGGAEPSWACSQNGGYSTGIPECTTQSDLVCCAY